MGSGLHVSQPSCCANGDKRSERRRVSRRIVPVAQPECLGFEPPKGLGVKVVCTTIRRVLIALIYNHVQRMVRKNSECLVVITS